MLYPLDTPIRITLDKFHIAKLAQFKIITQYNTFDQTPWKPGEQLTFKHRLRIEPYAAIYVKQYRAMLGGTHSHGFASIGFQSYSWSGLPESVEIGRYCSISNGVSFIDSHHPIETVGTGHWTHRNSFAITAALRDCGSETEVAARPTFDPTMGKPYPIIGHDVWIGHDVALSPGITVGTGSIIATGSVVTKDVKPYEIVGGNPAKHIRFRFADESLRERLLASAWWRYHVRDIYDLPFSDPAKFLDALQNKSNLAPYEPEPLILPDAWL